MADLKDNWKNVGTGLGHAFRDLGKAVGKTTADGFDSAADWACGEEPKEASVGKEEWGNVGKGLGFAFRDLGKAIVKSAKYGVDKATEWADDENTGSSEADDNK